MNDLRYSIRGLLNAPAFTIVAVLTLALGIGATTAIFSLFDAVVLRSLPVKNPGELVIASAGHYGLYQAFRKETELFADVLASASIEDLDVTLDGAMPEKTRVALVSASYFSTLGVPAAMGRVFGAGDERPAGEPAIAVVSHAYWQRRLARHPSVVGRVVRVRGVPITIVGVAPRGFFGEEVGALPDMWVPLTMWAQIVPGRDFLKSPGTSWLRIIGRLQPGVVVSQAEARLTITFRRMLEDVFGPRMPDDVRRDIDASTLKLTPAGQGVAGLRGRFAQPLQLLMAAVILLLLISCANVANLLLARAASRRREVDLRLALGMSRLRLVRQVMTESVVLSAVGAVLGLIFAWFGTEALLRLVSDDGSRAPVAIETDFRLIAFVALVSLTTAIIFGSVPAWRSLRASLVTSLASRRATDRSIPGVTSLLVVAQVAVSLVLMMGAGLFLRTLTNLRSVDLGFVPDRLVILNVNPRTAGYRGEQAAAFTQRLLERLKAEPGVSAVSFSDNGVMYGRDSHTNLIRPEGSVAGKEGYPRVAFDVVGPNYFATLGIPLIAGRDFTDRDNLLSPAVIAINEEMATRLFPGTNPVGRRLMWGPPEHLSVLEIVAVVRDVKQRSPRDDREVRFYVPYAQRPAYEFSSVQFLVRTAADSPAQLPMFQRAILREEPRLSIDGVYAANNMIDRSLVQERMIAKLSIAFGMLAVGLACVGLYGLIAYQVAQRTNEIGIRMALGAPRAQVLWATLRRAIVWTAAGIALGVPLALTASRAAESLLFGLSPTDVVTLVAAATIMLALGALAAFIPARRASRVDPLVALRYE